jgi:uncharacterized protein (TIGR03435 family)
MRHNQHPALTSFALICAAVAVCGAMQDSARPQGAPRLRFDVTSVKPSPRMINGGVAVDQSFTPRSVTIHGIRLNELIMRAFSLKAYQISGPEWLGSESYDVLAKTSEPVTDSVRASMYQDLLAERFKLEWHFETRSAPCYELVVARNGLKIHPVEPNGQGARMWNNGLGVRLTQASMSVFAKSLSEKVDRPVLDKTGVSGLFDFDVKWVPLTAEPEMDVDSSVVSALARLGLKLESKKSPILMLVVDRIERPSAN